MEGKSGWSGATAICAYLELNHVVVANIGDSRAVLCHKGEMVWESEDHSPELASERKRIMKAGSTLCRYNPNKQQDSGKCGCLSRMMMNFATSSSPLRLWPGGLALSRSIGDFEAKPGCISEPDFYEHDLNEDHEFLMICCDGVWDVFNSEQGCEAVRELLVEEKGEDTEGDIVKGVAAKMAQKAYDAGSDDNISVLVIKFHDPSGPRTCTLQKEAAQSNRISGVWPDTPPVIEKPSVALDVERDDEESGAFVEDTEAINLPTQPLIEKQ